MAPTYIPDAQVLGNQAAAAKLGVTIPALKTPAPGAAGGKGRILVTEYYV